MPEVQHKQFQMFGTYRFILSFFVLLHHIGYSKLMLIGVFAVEGFFILSGYHIALAYSINYSNRNKGTLRFYANRFLRIYPPYITVLSIALFIMFLLKNVAGKNIFPFTAFDILMNYLLVGLNYANAWNVHTVTTVYMILAVEVQFYFIFPLIFAWFVQKRAGLLAIVSIIWCLLVFFINDRSFGYVYMSLLPQLFVFLLGINLYFNKSKLLNFFTKINNKACEIISKRSFVILSFSLVLIFSVYYIRVTQNKIMLIFYLVSLFIYAVIVVVRLLTRTDKSNTDSFATYSSVFLFFYFLQFVIVQQIEASFNTMMIAGFLCGITVNLFIVSRLSRGMVIDNPRFQIFDKRLGGYSYGIFLIHDPVYLITKDLVHFENNPQEMILVSTIIIILTVILSHLLYRYVEQPLNTIRNTIRKAQIKT